MIKHYTQYMTHRQGLLLLRAKSICDKRIRGDEFNKEIFTIIKNEVTCKKCNKKLKKEIKK